MPAGRGGLGLPARVAACAVLVAAFVAGPGQGHATAAATTSAAGGNAGTGRTAPSALPSPAAQSDIIGRIESYSLGAEETLLDAAVGNGLGYVEMIIANPGVNAWVPDPAVPVILPSAHILPDAPREGIVINLADQRLYHFLGDGRVDTMPIGAGAMATSTPEGTTRVVRKKVRPTWYPPQSIRAEDPELPAAVAPGPDNPLGEYALYLGWASYLIHGTNRQYSIGRPLTHGCIRLYDADIERLHATVPVGTQVRVVDQPVKVGWHGGRLYLEVHPTQEQAAAIEAGEEAPRVTHTDMAMRIVDAVRRHVASDAGAADTMVDWRLVDRIAAEHRGVPVAIDRRPMAVSRDR